MGKVQGFGYERNLTTRGMESTRPGLAAAVAVAAARRLLRASPWPPRGVAGGSAPRAMGPAPTAPLGVHGPNGIRDEPRPPPLLRRSPRRARAPPSAPPHERNPPHHHHHHHHHHQQQQQCFVAGRPQFVHAAADEGLPLRGRTQALNRRGSPRTLLRRRKQKGFIAALPPPVPSSQRTAGHCRRSMQGRRRLWLG